MTAPIDLAAGGSGDVAAIDQLMRDAFDPRFGEAWTRAQCLGILSLPNVWLTLARLDGALVGFALARVGADEAELLLLATAPAARRRGVASALLRAVMRDASRRGAVRLFLEVRSNNDAIALYRALGFIKVGERRGYYRGPGGVLYDAYTFECRLID